MARIVSGADREPSGLKEFAFTYDLFSKRKRDQEKQQQDAFNSQLSTMKLMEALQTQRVKSQQLLNQQAEAGDVRALQELALRARMDPKELRTKEAVDLLSTIKDPKNRAQALPSVVKLLDEEDRLEEYKSVQQMLQQASESPDRFQPEQIQGWAQRIETKRQSGESYDDVASEIMAVHKKVGEDLTNANENQEALAQAEQVLQVLPKGSFERRQAEIAFNAAASDQAGLKRPGFGASTLKAVQKAALGPRTGFEERQQAQADARIMPGLGKMTSGQMKEELGKEPTLGFGGPKIPEYTGGSRATTKGLKAGTIKPGLSKKKPNAKNVAQEVLQKSIGPKEALQFFRDRGFDVNDPAVLEEIKMALQEARQQ